MRRQLQSVREKTTAIGEFDVLIQRVRNREQQAAWELIAKYSRKIFRIVRRELSEALWRKFDSRDFVRVVWASVFARPDRLFRFGNPDEICDLFGATGSKQGQDRESHTFKEKQVQRE